MRTDGALASVTKRFFETDQITSVSFGARQQIAEAKLGCMRSGLESISSALVAIGACSLCRVGHVQLLSLVQRTFGQRHPAQIQMRSLRSHISESDTRREGRQH